MIPLKINVVSQILPMDLDENDSEDVIDLIE